MEKLKLRELNDALAGSAAVLDALDAIHDLLDRAGDRPAGVGTQCRSAAPITRAR